MNDLIARLKARLIDDCARWYRLWTVQLHSFMLLWIGLFEIAPAFPKEIAALLPSPFQGPVVAAYSALGIILRLVAQRIKNRA